MKNDLFVTVGEVAQELGVSKPFAYKLVKQMNEELETVSFHHYDWTGKNCQKVKRRFKTKRETTNLDMTFADFVHISLKFKFYCVTGIISGFLHKILMEVLLTFLFALVRI